MRVVATAMGFRDGSRVRPGTILDIPDTEKPGKWMRVLGEGDAPVAKRGRKAKEPETLSEIARLSERSRLPGEP